MAQKISIVIPNYNGATLLKNNLPKVLKNSGDCEVIVVDDGSTDDSVKILKKEFKNIRLIEQKKNAGFASTVNNGVQHASGDLVLLLNSDVTPRASYLKNALVHFKNPKLFGVGLADISHEDSKEVLKGRGGGQFEKGFLSHFSMEAKSGETLWISGGSSLIDREKFIELGGFDTSYAPFYWEDIDLSYRARKKGYYCLFEKTSVVDHFHEQGAIKKNFSDDYVKVISYKNQFLFVWKNITDIDLVFEHIGFFLAMVNLPKIYMSINPHDEKISDKEVLKNFKQ